MMGIAGSGGGPPAETLAAAILNVCLDPRAAKARFDELKAARDAAEAALRQVSERDAQLKNREAALETALTELAAAQGEGAALEKRLAADAGACDRRQADLADQSEALHERETRPERSERNRGGRSRQLDKRDGDLKTAEERAVAKEADLDRRLSLIEQAMKGRQAAE